MKRTLGSLTLFGKLPICHRLPERSFFFRGKQFPLCARCTGLLMGCWFYPLFVFDVINLSLALIVLLHFPLLIDGATQLYFNRESSNWLRFVTGLMAGISQVALLNYFAEYISQNLLRFLFA